MGPLELYLIYENDGLWEEQWRPLQGDAFTSLLTVVPKETMSHCLYGWSSPLVKALGLAPKGALVKLPLAAKECALRETCTFYDGATCFPTAKKMPWCFEPDGLGNPQKRRLASEVIKFWREGVYVVVVQENS